MIQTEKSPTILSKCDIKQPCLFRRWILKPLTLILNARKNLVSVLKTISTNIIMKHFGPFEISQRYLLSDKQKIINYASLFTILQWNFDAFKWIGMVPWHFDVCKQSSTDELLAERLIAMQPNFVITFP